MKIKSADAEGSALGEIAAAFVHARRSRKSLTAYPGDIPESLETAYAIQDLAINRWDAEPAGWKVGRITGADAQSFGVDRLAGPIFPELLWSTAKAPADIGVFKDGFAAVEGEVVAVLGENAPADKLDWTAEEALALIESLRAGAEVASSPYAGINDDGPLVTISDFGNNFGLIVGDEIPDWRAMQAEDWLCKTFIDDELVGDKTPADIPGGPIESLRFLLENTARRGHPLKKGMAVCTGAVTGVHEIEIGQRARIEFAGAAPIEFEIVDVAQTKHGSVAKNTAAE